MMTKTNTQKIIDALTERINSDVDMLFDSESEYGQLCNEITKTIKNAKDYEEAQKNIINLFVLAYKAGFDCRDSLIDL